MLTAPEPAPALDPAVAAFFADMGDPLAEDKGKPQPAAAITAKPVLTQVAKPAAKPSPAVDTAKILQNTAKPRPTATKAGVHLVTAAAIIPENVKWIWRGYFAAGKFHVVAGPPGVAKTTLLLKIIAILTTGGILPDGTRAEVGDVIIWSGEDDPADTLVPRLIAAGADLNRVRFVQGTRDADGKLQPFDPAFDMEILADALAGGNVKLLVLDPVVSAVQGDDHKNAGTRRALQPVVDLAASVGCAVVGISHFSKGTQGKDPTERVTGSLAYGALARVVFAVVKDKDATDEFDRLFVRTKSNVGPDGGGWRFAVEQMPVPGYPGMVASAVKFGDQIDGHARDILATAEMNGDSEEHNATSEAVEWLQHALADGPAEAGKLQREAKAAGITERPLRSARQKLGIKPARRQFSGGWWWALPDAVADAGRDEEPINDDF